jgi:hypothetical protein
VNYNELSLEVAKTYNLKTMRLVDTSKYCEGIDVENYLIEILPVNRKDWVVFHVHKHFNLTVNSSSLGYKKVSNSAQLIELPDGIYEFKQSHKPNSGTVVHFLHMRTAMLNLKYVEMIGNHFANKCTTDPHQYEHDAQKLIKVKQYIEGSEYSVEVQHDKTQGIKFYNQAAALLNEFDKHCGCK